MTNLTISNSHQAVDLEQTVTTMISSSNFTNNGMNNTNGGAV